MNNGIGFFLTEVMLRLAALGVPSPGGRRLP
jgi:hypothetical protein